MGNGSLNVVKADQYRILPGDKFVLLLNRAGTGTLEMIAGETQTLPENLAFLIGGLQSLYGILIKDPKYAPSPIVQPFAGAKKIGG